MFVPSLQPFNQLDTKKYSLKLQSSLHKILTELFGISFKDSLYFKAVYYPPPISVFPIKPEPNSLSDAWGFGETVSSHIYSCLCHFFVF